MSMYLLGLLAVPLIVGVVAAAIGKGELTLKELAVQELGIVLLIGLAYGGSVLVVRMGAMADTEIWNGQIERKDKAKMSCCHSYPCNPYPCNCNKKGVCSTCYRTCYRHSRDLKWTAKTSNNETAYSVTCKPPGTSDPGRWLQIVVGEPTSIEHHYTNYIKADPDTVFRRTGVGNKFPGLVPPYPRVYDHYRLKPFIDMKAGVPGDVAATFNKKLTELSGRIGHRKQSNIIVIAVKTADIDYKEAIEQAWLGGKKNDVIVIIGMEAYPDLAFVSVVTWSRSEEMKLAIRDKIMDLKKFDGDKILSTISEEVRSKFKRREMKEYEYLVQAIEPPWWLMLIIFVIGIAASVVASVYFIKNDPFGGGHSNRFHRFHRRFR